MSEPAAIRSDLDQLLAELRAEAKRHGAVKDSKPAAKGQARTQGFEMSNTVSPTALTGGKELSGEGARLARARTAETVAEFALAGLQHGPAKVAAQRRLWAVQAALRRQEAEHTARSK